MVIAKTAFVEDGNNSLRPIDPRILEIREIALAHDVQVDFVLRSYNGFPRTYATQLLRCNGVLCKVSFCESLMGVGKNQYWNSKIPELGQASVHLHAVRDNKILRCFLVPPYVTAKARVFSVAVHRIKEANLGAPRKVDWFVWEDRWDILGRSDEFGLIQCSPEF